MNVNINNISYISKDESSVIKAILMFLIVLGHNMIFTTSLERYHIMEYIYQFHIQAFFLLPFLYGTKPLSKKRLGDYFVRYLWPFVSLTFTSFILYHVIYQKQEFDIVGLLQMWLTGDTLLIKKYCGVQIFWFLPAMFSMTIFKDLYYYSNRYIKALLLTLSFCTALLSFLSTDYGFYYGIWHKINLYAPFSAFKGISYLVFGVALRKIVKKTYQNRNDFRYIYAILFSLSSVLFFYNAILHESMAIKVILNCIFPVSFVLLLWCYRRTISTCVRLREIGKQTFLMYLCHPYIGYSLYYVIKYCDEINLVWALVAQLIMFFGSFYIAQFINHFEKIRIILTPHSMKELNSLFG